MIGIDAHRSRAIILTVVAVVVPGIVSRQTTGHEPIKTNRISGRITDETGAPLSNATLKCSNTDHREDTGTTMDTDGRFAFTVASHNEYEIYQMQPRKTPSYRRGLLT